MQTVINLDPSFTPLGEGIPIDVFDFPSGCEPHVKILNPEDVKGKTDVVITCRLSSSNEIIRLMLLCDALNRLDIAPPNLIIPYLPFARQDRVMVEGEPLSIKVMCRILNGLNLNKINVLDVHSEVASALLDRVHVIPNHQYVKSVLKGKTNYYIASPDRGASKKIIPLCQFLEYDDVLVQCDKIRNLKTGQIIKFTCDAEDLQGKDIYIIDDICSKGGTFIALCKLLKERNCGNIYLIVTHYEGTAKIDELSEAGLTAIYKTNSMNDINTPFIRNTPLRFQPK